MRHTLLAAVSLAVAVFSLPVQADGLKLTPHHPRPSTFLFGNHLDSHQQTRRAPDGSLHGFLYVTRTGEVTPEGYPVVRHCSAETPPRECFAGWILRARPGAAIFLYQEMDHPVWLTARSELPQPGAFVHFHWITSRSTDPRPVTDPRCDAEMAEELTPGATCPGYFIELLAIRRFAFEHEGQRVLVEPGIDVATHLNVVTSFPASP
jgi:hypothetical protein